MHRGPVDLKGRRIAIAMAVSCGLNAVLLLQAAQIFRWNSIAPSSPILVTLITIPPMHHRAARTMPRKLLEPRKLKFDRPVPLRPRLAREHLAKSRAHNRVLISNPGRHPSPSRATALPGGDAPVGVPIGVQKSGVETTNAPAAQPAPVVAPPISAQPPAPLPFPTPPAAAPAPSPPEPEGQTQDAAATNEVDPDIPDELKEASFRATVHVKVDVRADGSFTPTLTSSSGNAEIDRYVLDALRQWKWKPALKNGVPVESTKYFRFDFEVD